MNDNNIRRIVLRKASEISDDVPVWAWQYADRGRIARDTVALFAGRPGAGKSTSARWFAAQATTGTLPGCWLGQPINVAYIAREEAVEYIVKPSLRAHSADLTRMFFPEVVIESESHDDETRPISIADMHDLTKALRSTDVHLVIVDPLMALAGAKVDINRNNEVRELIEPWRHLAEAINGVVLGVAHLNKAGNGDVVAGINGSSAFGEVARAVFGFAKDPNAEDGSRVMSQEKNSLGDEDLALRYRIDTTTVTTDSGKSAEMGRFVILGDSDKSVGDVLRDAGRPADTEDGPERSAAKDWLRRYLGDGTHDSADAKRDGRSAGFSERTLQRARQDLAVVIRPHGRKSTWCLPNAATPSSDVARGTRGTGHSSGEMPAQSHIENRPQPVPPVPGIHARERQPGETPPGAPTATTPGMTARVLEIADRANRQQTGTDA